MTKELGKFLCGTVEGLQARIFFRISINYIIMYKPDIFIILETGPDASSLQKSLKRIMFNNFD